MQAKLLRVLHSHEVHVLGAVRAVPVDIRVCSASHELLHSLFASGVCGRIFTIASVAPSS